MRPFIDRWGAVASLIGVAAIWGSTFVIVADAIAAYPMYAFLGWRFAVATVAFALFFPRSLRQLNADNLKAGVIAGVFLSAGYIFQTWGLDGVTRTTPARAAFITGMYVVIVPLAQAVVLRRMPRKATLLGAALAVGGLWLLSGIGSGGAGVWVLGDTLVLVCAVAYSVHMLILGATDERHDTGALTLVQLAVVTVVTSGISLVTEAAGVPSRADVLIAIGVTGVLASAVAFAVQTWAQRRLPPARVALILVMEPAFGGLFGWSVAGLWPLREVAGAALMLGGMITSEAVAAIATPGEHIEYEPAVEGMPVPVLEEGYAGADVRADVVHDAEDALDPHRGAL